MTVSTLTNQVTYTGNGSATSFAVPFKVLDVDHLVVQRLIAATGAVDHTYIGTNYSYSGIGNDSGTLTLSGTALSSTYKLFIKRVVPYTQELDLVNAGGFYPETVEEQLDLTTMQIQQIATLSEDIEERALMVPAGETAPVLPVHPGDAGYALTTTEAGLDWDELNFTVTAASGSSVDTRVLLRGIASPANGQTAYLMEAGRVGWFRFNSADLSANVTADPREGIYVAPSAAPTGASGAWVRVVVTDVVQASWFGLTGNGVADDQPAVQAALNAGAGGIVEAPLGDFGLNTQLIIPSNTWFRGRGAGTEFIPLATYTPRTAGFNQGITCANTSTNVKCTDMTWNGNKVGLGLGAGQRICGFVPSGTNFYFARLSIINCSGYAVWTFGKVAGTPCSGKVENVRSNNADIHFESSISNGVTWEDCHAVDGDGDLPNAHVFHPYDRSTNIKYINCTGVGSFASPMASIADAFDINIQLINCEITTDVASALALQPTGAFVTQLDIIGGKFISTNGNGLAVIADVKVNAVGATFSGSPIGVGFNDAHNSYFSNCTAIGTATSPTSSYGIYAESNCTDVHWYGGSLQALGSGAVRGHTSFVEVSLDTDRTPSMVLDYADDAAAAASGFIGIGCEYRNGSVMMVRVA